MNFPYMLTLLLEIFSKSVLIIEYIRNTHMKYDIKVYYKYSNMAVVYHLTLRTNIHFVMMLLVVPKHRYWTGI